MGFFGDMGCESTQIGTIVNSDPFMYIKKWMNTLDFTVANLETTFSGYESDYPKFSSSDIFANFLKGKFDLLLTANNHSLDGGVKGALRTNKLLDKIGIPHIGTGSPERPRITYDVKLNGFDITFLNYVTSINGERTEKSTGFFQEVNPEETPTGIVNFYSETEIKEKIDLAKERSEFIIPTIHQRNPEKIREYGEYASEKQIEDLESILDMGANVVIGGHPHDFQGGCLYSQDRIIVYSLGNFYSSMTNKEYPVNAGCIMVMNVDAYQNTQYTFLPVCTAQVQGMFYVFPMAPIEMGAYPFIQQEERNKIISKLQEIRGVLSRCGLEEEMIQPQYL